MIMYLEEVVVHFFNGDDFWTLVGQVDMKFGVGQELLRDVVD